jgi:hypothetical protein
VQDSQNGLRACIRFEHQIAAAQIAGSPEALFRM